MSERYIFIPNWDELQHYKDRGRPTWIKLYPRLLRNDDFVDLSATERMALIGIWMLYAESGRRLALDTTKLTRSLNQRITKRTLDRLNGAGFIEFRSRTALDEVYAREEKKREETHSKDESSAREETAETSNTRSGKPTEAEVVTERERRERSGYVENIGQYTGCRLVRGEMSIHGVYDPLGTEYPPDGWPHQRPTRLEIVEALRDRDQAVA